MSEEEELLSNRSVKPSAVRILVLRFLIEHNNAVSLKILEQNLAFADRSSLFRTLKTFEKNGLVHSIDDGSGTKKYALCMVDCECLPIDNHLHFFCTSCQETYCFNTLSIPKFDLPVNFVANKASLVLKGTCANYS